MKNYSMLIVDDEPLMNSFLEETFRRKGFTLALAQSGNEAVELLDKHIFDIVITDYKLPDLDGIEVLKKVKNVSPSTEVILITAYGTAESAVQAMRIGAADYISKPFTPDEIEYVVDNVLSMYKEKAHSVQDINDLKNRYDFSNIIAVSPEMYSVLQLISKVAKTDATILIQGESGTGKELVARAIHYNSTRLKNAFVTVNCAAISENLLESELFGHKKGSFTGAIQEKEGLFKVADGGTVFLDEIGDMGQSLQSKLLRFLQEKEFMKVGGVRPVNVDVRVIAATNRDLKKDVADGVFREDLYFRLNVIPIFIPPLKERKEDIPVLVKYFVNRFTKEMNKDIQRIDDKVVERLKEYDWPGNVRELENVIRRAVTLEDSNILTDNEISLLSQQMKKEKYHPVKLNPEGISLKMVLDDIERDLILQALARSNDSQTLASKLLDLKRTTLIEKMRKYGILKND